jgi:methyl-accepting chemotaxis protein
MSIRKRLFVILALVYIVSMVGAIAGGYYILERESLREAKEKVELFTSVMSANQEFMATSVRPDLMDLLPDTYFPEATVGIVMMDEAAKIIREEYPEYIFKIASPNPLDRENLSDSFENSIIASFDNGDFDKWEGSIFKTGKHFYATAVPIEARKSCIWCHDTPATADPEMVETYGTQSGYGYKVGDIVGGRFIYVSMDKADAITLKKLAMFGGGLSLLFLIAMLVIDRTVINTIVKPIEEIVAVAEEISRGKMDREFEVKGNDEIKLLADAFNRMRVSLAKAMDILRK